MSVDKVTEQSSTEKNTRASSDVPVGISSMMKDELVRSRIPSSLQKSILLEKKCVLVAEGLGCHSIAFRVFKG